MLKLVLMLNVIVKSADVATILCMRFMGLEHTLAETTQMQDTK